MPRWQACNLICTLCAVCLHTSQASSLDAHWRTLPDGQGLQVAHLRSVPAWQLFPNLWVDKRVEVSCPDGQELQLYVAQDAEALDAAIANKVTTWCGWDRYLGGQRDTCAAQISPFKPALVGALRPAALFSRSGRECSFELTERLSWLRICQGLAGAGLFLWAPQLVHSMAFRLGTGSLTFAMLSLLILLFLVARLLPNKRSIMAALATGGSFLPLLMRYVFGSYIPSFQQLMVNPLAVGFMGMSALAGLALTYYYDNPRNAKLMTILQVGLQLLGLSLVALSTTLPEASALACCSLVAWHLVPSRRRHLLPASPQSPTAAAAVVRDGADDADPNRADAREEAADGYHEQREKTPLQQLREAFTGNLLDVQSPIRSRSSTKAASHGRPQGGEGMATPPHLPSSPRRDHNSSQRITSPFRRDPASSQKVASASSGRQQQQQQLQYLVNEDTGRAIKIHGPTYHKLLAQGYQVDYEQGSITPPAKHASKTSSRTPGFKSPARRGQSGKHSGGQRRSGHEQAADPQAADDADGDAGFPYRRQRQVM